MSVVLGISQGTCFTCYASQTLTPVLRTSVSLDGIAIVVDEKITYMTPFAAAFCFVAQDHNLALSADDSYFLMIPLAMPLAIPIAVIIGLTPLALGKTLVSAT